MEPEIVTERGPQFGPASRIVWRVACKIAANGGDSNNIRITMPIPQDWPEQTVVQTDESVPPETAQVEIRDLPRAPRQVVMNMASLRKGNTAVFSFDYDVEIRPVLPPADTSWYQVPEKLEKDLRHWLEESPRIKVKEARLRTIARELATGPATSGWERVAAIQGWVFDNVQPGNEPREDTADTIKQKSGTSEDRFRLFVALCRASGIPARLVWADNNDHAEFYLVDDRGGGHWFPCLLSPGIPLGCNPHPKVVLQKGDHFEVPEKKKQELEFVTGFVAARGTGRPAVGFVEGPVR